MTNTEKIALLEDMLEMKAGALKESTILKEIPSWDSMAALSLIVICDEKFGKKLSGDQISNFRSVKDIIDFMS